MRIKSISFGIHTVFSMVTDYDLCWINCNFLLSVKDETLEIGKMAHGSVGKLLLCKTECQGLALPHPHKKLDMEIHICNSTAGGWRQVNF